MLKSKPYKVEIISQTIQVNSVLSRLVHQNTKVYSQSLHTSASASWVLVSASSATHQCTIDRVMKESGAQPLLSEDGSLSLAVNGEIYNHRVLRKQLRKPYNFKTHSDCEVILPLVRVLTRHHRNSVEHFSISNMVSMRQVYSMACSHGYCTTVRRTGR